MKYIAKILINYLRDVICNPSQAALNVEELPGDFQDFGRELKSFAECASEIRPLSRTAAKEDCGTMPPRAGKMTGNQAASLEQSNLLLASLMHHVPQQIIVMDRDTREILIMNDMAAKAVNGNADYMNDIMSLLPDRGGPESGYDTEVLYAREGRDRYLMVTSYLLEWNNSNAEVFSITDISGVKKQIKELEGHAYRDGMTGLCNRAFGMLTLEEWLNEKKRFALIFADLDNLKYINDKYGHREGDKYIISAAGYFSNAFPQNAVVCRLGGDEFVLLAPDTGYGEAHAVMSRVCLDLQNDKYLDGKEYSYRVSFGIAAVESDNELPASDILSIADERMYEYKRMKKAERQNMSERRAV